MLRSRENESLKLSSGSMVGLAHYGDSSGPVVFYFHGLGSSRLEGAWWAKAAEAVGAHIIALDRPGVGLSSVQPNRRLLDWPIVVSEVAQRLKIDQFYALGNLAGGSYALACAKELSPNTLKGVGLVGGSRPASQNMGSRMLYSFNSWWNRKVYEQTIIPAATDPDPTVFHKQIIEGIYATHEKDKALFENVEFRDFMTNAERECNRQGSQGVADELRVSVKDWGFDLQSISLKKIRLWCGTEVLEYIVGSSRKMETQISQAKLVEFKGDTHFSTIATRGEQILRELLFDDEKSYGQLLPKDAYKMSPSREHECLKLPSGTTVGLTHYGDSSGPVVFYFHGLGSSRLEGAWWAKAAESVGAHIIALDRPGVGLSSVQPNRRLLDWPIVVSEVAQYLKIDEFYALGTMAGGPYALACAKELSPDTLKGVGLVGSFGPLVLTMGSSMKYSLKGWVSRKVYEKGVIPAAENPDPTVFQKQIIEGTIARSETDKALFENVEFRDFLVDQERECLRQGSQGVTDELRIAVKDWGFDLQSISLEKIRLWCGTEDVEAPIDMSRKMETQISQAKLVEFEGDTHYSTLATRGEQILRGLLFDDEKSDGRLLSNAYN